MSSKVSKEKMAEIEAKIEADRRRLAETKGMAEEERNRVMADLEVKEKELKKAHDEQAALSTKLQALEKKIIVGGVNLLEKAEEQQRLLEESAKELEQQHQKETQLKQAIRMSAYQHNSRSVVQCSVIPAP